MSEMGEMGCQQSQELTDFDRQTLVVEHYPALIAEQRDKPAGNQQEYSHQPISSVLQKRADAGLMPIE